MWSIPEEWPGETCYVVCGGPSVPAETPELLAGRRVIVVNSSYQLVPAADFLIFHDSRWWPEHQHRLKAFAGRIIGFMGAPGGDRVLRIRRKDVAIGLSAERDALVMGKTTLQPALNLAVLLGARRIVILGADMGPGPDGRTHHHAPHRWAQKPGCWDEQMKFLAYIVEPLRQAGVDVLNASPVSRLPWWPKVNLKDALQCR